VRIAFVWLSWLVLSLASTIVPRGLRAEWLAEWRGELAYLRAGNDGGSSRVLTFAWGSLPDAVTLWRIQPKEDCCDWDQAFRSPLRCLGWMSGLAWVALVAWGAGNDHAFSASHDALPHWIMVCLGFLAAFVRNPAIIAGPLSTAVHIRHRVVALVFLFCKTVLAIGIAGLLTAIVLRPLSSGTVQAHAFLLPYLFACRWSILDQAKRCPICLCQVGNPVQIGSRPTALVDGYEMEYMCRRGHGLLYESLFEGAFCSRRWTPLDQSWKDLFIKGS